VLILVYYLSPHAAKISGAKVPASAKAWGRNSQQAEMILSMQISYTHATPADALIVVMAARPARRFAAEPVSLRTQASRTGLLTRCLARFRKGIYYSNDERSRARATPGASVCVRTKRRGSGYRRSVAWNSIDRINQPDANAPSMPRRLAIHGFSQEP